MVERQLRRRGITDPAILEAFATVPREAFVGAAHAHLAYGDHPLPIAAGQTISQPYIVALMIEAANVRPTARVLEVGSGSGYAAGVISRIVERVVGIERQHELVEPARERLRRLGYDNVHIVEGDGTRGWPEEAPYDAILASAAGNQVPQPLVQQLAPGGTIVMPVGRPSGIQRLLKITRDTNGALQQSDLGEVRFVPLVGEEGWSDDRG